MAKEKKKFKPPWYWLSMLAIFLLTTGTFIIAKADPPLEFSGLPLIMIGAAINVLLALAVRKEVRRRESLERDLKTLGKPRRRK